MDNGKSEQRVGHHQARGRHAGTDAEKIRSALEGLTLTTPNGTYHYSATNHAGLTAKYIAIDVVKGGKIQATDWAQTELAAVAGG